MFSKSVSRIVLCLMVFGMVLGMVSGCGNGEKELTVQDSNLYVNLSTGNVSSNLESQNDNNINLTIEKIKAVLIDKNGKIYVNKFDDFTDSISPSIKIPNLTVGNEYSMEIEASTINGNILVAKVDDIVIRNENNTVNVELIYSGAKNINFSAINPAVNLCLSETAIIYYRTDWPDAYFHYALDGSNWTDVPGEEMRDSEYPGIKIIEIETNGAGFIECVFNNGNGVWDNNNGQNYIINTNVSAVVDGVVLSDISPVDFTVYYRTDWENPYIHYAVNGSNWTQAPGVLLEDSEFQGYSKIRISGFLIDYIEAVFNNGNGVWDNNNGQNYILNTNVSTVENGEIIPSEPDPETFVIYYRTDWDNAYIHYAINGENWTRAPGVRMDNSDYLGYKKVDITSSNIEYIEAAFNDGYGNWDNNNRQNYILNEEVMTVENQSIKIGPPYEIIIPELPDIPDEMINETLYQAFYYDSYEGLWSDIAYDRDEYIDVDHMAEIGITAMWLPPATKGDSGTSSVGYDVYDLWDLGEFNQKETVRTRYGTKEELDDALFRLNQLGIDAYCDAVFNHRMGGNPETVTLISGQEIEAYSDFELDGRDFYYSNAGSFDWNWDEFDGLDYTTQGSIPVTLFEGKNWDNTYSYDYLMGLDVDYSRSDIRDEMNEWGEWIINDVGFNGFRIDAAIHVDNDFLRQWINNVQWLTAETIPFILEAWTGDIGGYLDLLGNDNIMAFDFPLRDNFVDLSSGNKDLRWWGGLIYSPYAEQAVTFVDNHDTCREGNPYNQPQVISFKNQAYAYILMREYGLPTVYARDYDEFGMNPTLDKLIEARRYFAYGTGHENASNDYDTYSYVREGLDNVPGTGLVMMISDSRNGGITTKELNSYQANTTYYDFTGNMDGTVTTDSNGYGYFKVRQEEGRGWSIWVPLLQE